MRRRIFIVSPSERHGSSGGLKDRTDTKVTPFIIIEDTSNTGVTIVLESNGYPYLKSLMNCNVLLSDKSIV